MHKYKTHVRPREGAPIRKRAEDILAPLLLERFDGRPGPILVAVGGPGGTGKSTFCARLAEQLPEAAVLRVDDYKTPRAERANRNIFGAHPSANKMALLREHLALAKQGQAFDKPVYDAATGEADATEVFRPARFTLLDGEISTYRDFRNLVDFALFIDSDLRTQLATRTSRDIDQRGYTWEKAIATFLQSNLREFARYGAESKNWADVHLYCHDDYRLAVESVSEEIYERHRDLFAPDLAPVDLSGLVVPALTPFTQSNKIDRGAFIEHLEFLADAGVRRILVSGTTAEFFSLTSKERKILLQLAREYFPGVVLFHAGATGLAQTLELARLGEDLGADAIAAIAPYYIAEAPADGVVDYFNALADRLEAPLILYNFPRHTQNALTPDMVRRIRHYAIKDSSSNLALLAATPRYFLGGDPKIVESHRLGGAGFVSAPANHAPEPYVAMENALARQDYPEADRLLEEIVTIRNAASGTHATALIKAHLARRLSGYPTRVRLPLTEAASM